VAHLEVHHLLLVVECGSRGGGCLLLLLGRHCRLVLRCRLRLLLLLLLLQVRRVRGLGRLVHGHTTVAQVLHNDCKK
jgi:hypothetical protein